MVPEFARTNHEHQVLPMVVDENSRLVLKQLVCASGNDEDGDDNCQPLPDGDRLVLELSAGLTLPFAVSDCRDGVGNRAENLLVMKAAFLSIHETRFLSFVCLGILRSVSDSQGNSGEQAYHAPNFIEQ